MTSLIRIVVAGLALMAYPLVSAAQVPQSALGTWKLNVAKSTYSPGPPPTSITARQEAAPGGGMKVTADVVDATGKATQNEIVSMFDGKEAEFRGAAAPTTRAYSRVDDQTIQWVTRVNGKVTTTTRATVSADNKTATLITTGTGANGNPVNNTAVWDRQ